MGNKVSPYQVPQDQREAWVEAEKVESAPPSSTEIPMVTDVETIDSLPLEQKALALMKLEHDQVEVDKTSDLYDKLIELRTSETPIFAVPEEDRLINKENAKKAVIFLAKVNLEAVVLAIAVSAIIVYKAMGPHRPFAELWNIIPRPFDIWGVIDHSMSLMCMNAWGYVILANIFSFAILKSYLWVVISGVTLAGAIHTTFFFLPSSLKMVGSVASLIVISAGQVILTVLLAFRLRWKILIAYFLTPNILLIFVVFLYDRFLLPWVYGTNDITRALFRVFGHAFIMEIIMIFSRYCARQYIHGRPAAVHLLLMQVQSASSLKGRMLIQSMSLTASLIVSVVMVGVEFAMRVTVVHRDRLIFRLLRYKPEEIEQLLKRQAAMRLRPDCMHLEMAIENLGILTAPVLIYMYQVPSSTGVVSPLWQLIVEAVVSLTLELLVDFMCVMMERKQGVVLFEAHATRRRFIELTHIALVCMGTMYFTLGFSFFAATQKGWSGPALS